MSRRPRTPRRRRFIALWVVLVCLLGVAAAANFTFADFTASTSAPLSISTTTVGAVGSPAVAPNTGFPTCNSEVLTWTAATNATAYKVEYQNNSTAGAWTVLTASTAALTYTDTNVGTHLNATVNYRITPLRTPGTWTGTPSILSVQCGIGPVLDLAVTNLCTTNVLTFTTPYNNTTTYKVEYSTNGGGAWTSSGNLVQTGTSNGNTYFNLAAPVLTKGTTYIYRVTPNSGAGSLSNTSNSITWDNFHVESVVFAGGGGTLTNGDTVTTKFSKTETTTGVTLNDAKMAFPVAVNRRRALLGATATTNNGIGQWSNNANQFSNTGNVNTVANGTAVWSANGTYAHAQLVWTSDGTTTAGGTLNMGNTGTVTWTAAAGSAQCDPTPPTLLAGAIAKVNLSAAPAGATTSFTGRF